MSYFSNGMFNIIEYFNYCNIWLLYLWFLFMIISIIIMSSLLYIISLNFQDMLLEFFFSFYSFWYLLLLISPSLILLFNLDYIMIIKFLLLFLGYQWAWIINYLSFIYLYYDHFMLIYYYMYYLLDFNRYIIFSMFSNFSINIFSFDVIHCLGLYSFGIKIDGIPGRINLAIILSSMFKGEYKGYCFELCGQGHSSMLINGMMLNLIKFL